MIKILTIVETLEAAGFTAEQIVRAVKSACQQKIADRREQNRKAKQKQRSCQQNVADIADIADTSPPSPPPSMVSPITPSLTTPSTSPSSSLVLRERFEEFWKAYPKRQGANPKAPARDKFVRLVSRGESAEAIIAGVKAYASDEATKPDTEFVAMATTWLNQRRWEDYAVRAGPPDKPWQPPPGSGLRTDEEIRRDVERRKAEELAGAGTDVLAPKLCVHGQKQNGLDFGQAGNGGIRRMGAFFPLDEMEAVRSEND